MLYKVYISLYFKITLVNVCFSKPCSLQKRGQPSTFAQFCNATQCTIGEPNNYSPPLLLFYFCDHTQSNNSDHRSFQKLCNP